MTNLESRRKLIARSKHHKVGITLNVQILEAVVETAKNTCFWQDGRHGQQTKWSNRINPKCGHMFCTVSLELAPPAAPLNKYAIRNTYATIGCARAAGFSAPTTTNNSRCHKTHQFRSLQASEIIIHMYNGVGGLSYPDTCFLYKSWP